MKILFTLLLSVFLSSEASANTAPVVAAGNDISAQTTGSTGMIQINGVAIDAQNNITSYRILRNNIVMRSGSSYTVFTGLLELPLGTHTLVFEAQDATGLIGRDSLIATISSNTNTAPVVNAGSDISINVSGTARERHVQWVCY